MKLYTEELKKLNSIKSCLMAHPDNEPDSEFADRINDCDEIIDSLTLIELPSDEEEEVNAMSLTKNIQQHIGFNMGAKWMKEQILNQNK